jgi:hypothetical protein
MRRWVALRQGSQLAEGQKSAEVKHFWLRHPPLRPPTQLAERVEFLEENADSQLPDRQLAEGVFSVFGRKERGPTKLIDVLTASWPFAGPVGQEASGRNSLPGTIFQPRSRPPGHWGWGRGGLAGRVILPRRRKALGLLFPTVLELSSTSDNNDARGISRGVLNETGRHRKPGDQLSLRGA